MKLIYAVVEIFSKISVFCSKAWETLCSKSFQKDMAVLGERFGVLRQEFCEGQNV